MYFFFIITCSNPNGNITIAPGQTNHEQKKEMYLKRNYLFCSAALSLVSSRPPMTFSCEDEHAQDVVFVLALLDNDA